MLPRRTKIPWHRTGTDPDYRFSLANERTFLAWIRSILAILATVVVLDQFAAHADRPEVFRSIGIALALLASLAAGCCYFKWRANEISMRHAKPLPTSRLLALVGAVIFAVTVTLAIYVAR